MRRRGLEKRFEAFRRKGDVAALERVFDGTAPELMRVAMHLARDAATAEDLVQGTFVAAIEHAAGWDEERPLMPWLLGILARQAARARRESGRRPDPERLPDRAGSDPAAQTEAAEVSGQLSRALGGLPSPYREVLAPHLLEGARAVDIARELERAPGTVRMQILRGLELLRKALPPSLASCALLATGTRGEAAVRAAVLDKAAASAPTLAAAGAASVTTPLLFLGGLTMSAKTVISLVGAAGVVAASWLLVGRGTPAAAPGRVALAEPEAPALTAPELPPDDVVAAPAARSREERAAVVVATPEESTASPEPGWWLVGTLHGVAPDVDPSPWINVFCNQLTVDTCAAWARPDGTYEVEVTPIFTRPAGSTRELLVSVNHPSYQVANATILVDAATTGRSPDERTEIPLDIEMFPASGIEGRVVVPDGFAMHGVTVALFSTDDGGAPENEVRSIEPEPDGSFGIHKRDPGEYLVVASADGLHPAFARADFVVGEVAHVGDLVLEVGATAIEGRLVLLPGMELDGCRVAARPVQLDEHSEEWHWPQPLWNGERFDLSVSIATCDGEGRFRITGLEPGAHVLTLDDVPGANLIEVGSVESAAPATGVVFAPDVTRFTVDVTSAGRPVAQSKLQLVDSPNWHDFWTRDDGRAIGLARADVDYVLYANKEGHETRSVELPAEGRELDVAVAIELAAMPVGTASLVLEPRGSGELDVDRVTIRMEATVDTPYSLVDEHVQLEDGAFTLTGLHPGPYLVSVEPHENTIGPYYETFRRCSSFTVELEDGEVHRRAVDLELGGRLRVEVTGFRGPELESRCRVIDERGEELFVRFVTRSFEDNIISVGANSATTSLTEPADVYPNLRPGTYLIRLEIERHHPLERTVVVRAGEVTEVELPVSRL